jgi:hypothetical protein
LAKYITGTIEPTNIDRRLSMTSSSEDEIPAQTPAPKISEQDESASSSSGYGSSESSSQSSQVTEKDDLGTRLAKGIHSS